MLESLFNKVADLKQVFSCEIGEIFKNSFFYRTLPVAVSVKQNIAHIHYSGRVPAQIYIS